MRSEAKERAAEFDKLPTHLRFAAGERCYMYAGGDEETPPPQKRARRREQCRFGHDCYRKRNPQHMRELAHPGDADWLDPTVGGSGVIDLSQDD